MEQVCFRPERSCFDNLKGSEMCWKDGPCADPTQILPQIETTLWTSFPQTAGSISSSNYTWNDLMLKPIDGVGIENPATSTGRRRITRQLSSRDLQQSFNPSHRHSLPMWKMDSTNLLNHKVGRSFFCSTSFGCNPLSKKSYSTDTERWRNRRHRFPRDTGPDRVRYASGTCPDDTVHGSP